MRFHANSVSASEEGDYFQIWLKAKDSAQEAANMIIQRDFETSDGRRCSVALQSP
jgi:hypothetical protein